MAEITKVTTPMIPRENMGAKNKPISEQTVEINSPSRVNKPAEDNKVSDRQTGGQALRENLTKAVVQPLLRDAGDLMYNIRKMITLLQLGTSTSDVMKDPQIKQMLDKLFIPPEQLEQLIKQQDEASVLFKGGSFEVLRDVAQKFSDHPNVRDALVELLKTFEQNVNAQNSIKTILHNCNNLLDYMFKQDKEQFSQYLQSLAQMLLPEEAENFRATAELLYQSVEGMEGEEAAQLLEKAQTQDGAQQPKTPPQLPNLPTLEEAKGEATQPLTQKEAANVLKNNLLPLLGEIVVKYHQNERIRDMVMVVVHNIVRVDKGTPEALREAVDNLVSELKKVANLPENFDKNLLSALQNGGKEAKLSQNEVISRLAQAISETLHSSETSPPILRQAENMLLSLLQNQNSMMNIMHFIIPLKTQDDRVFAELYVDPESDESHSKGKDGEATRKIFISADSENHGRFEFSFWQTGEKVDFFLKCPQVLIGPLSNMKRLVGDLMQIHGYTLSGYMVDEFIKPQTVAQVFPKLLNRKVGIDVRI